MSFVPKLAEDLKSLETGVKMYSCVYNEVVIVKAPFMFISGDKLAHSTVCSILQQSTLEASRNNTFGKRTKSKKKTLVSEGITAEMLNKRCIRRTLDSYTLAASGDRKTVEMANVLPGGSVKAQDLSFKNTGSDDLLQLSSYDPSQDTPVEILHCIPLGVGRYLIEYLVKVTLNGRTNEQRMARLKRKLEDNESNNAYVRTFEKKKKNLEHVSFFLSSEFKQLMQVLPCIIADEFIDPVLDKDFYC